MSAASARVFGPTAIRVRISPSAKASCTIPPPAGTVRYCSATWTKASATPFATWRGGRLRVASGSSTANAGKSAGCPKASLAPWPLWVTTAPQLLSDPVAGRVSTTPRGTAPRIFAAPVTSPQGSSPSWRRAAARNLLPSITEPPPTARMKSDPAARATSAARIIVSKLGLGSMPPNSATERPFNAAIT